MGTVVSGTEGMKGGIAAFGTLESLLDSGRHLIVGESSLFLPLLGKNPSAPA
ncbi:hypothetical protein NXF25_005789 [Crotalus adamanteus]|uniref:Uncharacterized protein n=1 Tax=Crotalus adamanteus TaxID=8729 RepID=A0AAW1BY83_CROAD